MEEQNKPTGENRYARDVGLLLMLQPGMSVKDILTLAATNPRFARARDNEFLWRKLYYIKICGFKEKDVANSKPDIDPLLETPDGRFWLAMLPLSRSIPNDARFHFQPYFLFTALLYRAILLGMRPKSLYTRWYEFLLSPKTNAVIWTGQLRNMITKTKNATTLQFQLSYSRENAHTILCLVESEYAQNFEKKFRLKPVRIPKWDEIMQSFIDHHAEYRFTTEGVIDMFVRLLYWDWKPQPFEEGKLAALQSCVFCGNNAKALLACGGNCQKAVYCQQQCADYHWNVHQKECQSK